MDGHDDELAPRGGSAMRIEFGGRLDDRAEPGYAAPATRLSGSAASSRFQPASSTIWCVSARLEPGATLSWDRDHGEEVVYVLGGALDVKGRRCPPGGAVILEAGVSAEVRAGGATRALHFGSGSLAPPVDGPFGAPAADGRDVRVIGSGGLAVYSAPDREARYFADGSSPTCRLALFTSARSVAAPQPPHSHSVDEIFVITEGEIVVGRRRIGAGMAVFVAADQRYAFQGGEEGYTMLNYRPDASYFSQPGTEERPIEGLQWPGITWVGDVIT